MIVALLRSGVVCVRWLKIGGVKNPETNEGGEYRYRPPYLISKTRAITLLIELLQGDHPIDDKSRTFLMKAVRKKGLMITKLFVRKIL